MSNGPTLPPQAYTREILSTAFNWLQSQPESVRKLATSPDALVGLYMRAQRYGHSSLEQDAPVSSQNFMSDLKHLAEGLKQFEEPRDLQNRRPQSQTQANGMGHQMQPQPPTHQQTQPHPQQHAQRPMPPQQAAPIANQNFAGVSAFHSGYQSAPPAPTYAQAPVQNGFDHAFQGTSGLNDRSLQMIHEVKAYFNLSTDSEAVNMMIALAYKNLKNLLT